MWQAVNRITGNSQSAFLLSKMPRNELQQITPGKKKNNHIRQQFERLIIYLHSLLHTFYKIVFSIMLLARCETCFFFVKIFFVDFFLLFFFYTCSIKNVNLIYIMSIELLNGILNGPRAMRPQNYECIYMDSKGWLRDDDLFEAPEYLIDCLRRAKVGFYVTRNGSVYAEKGGFEKAVKIAKRDYDENLENQR